MYQDDSAQNTPPKRKRFLHVTTHKFKTHFASYMRQINDGDYDAIIIKSYERPIGLVMPYKDKSKP